MVHTNKIIGTIIFIGLFSCQSKMKASENESTVPKPGQAVEEQSHGTKEKPMPENKPAKNETVPDTTTEQNRQDKYALLPHLLEQQTILREKSVRQKDTHFMPDGKYSHGNFDEGVLNLKIINIDGEPHYLYGQAEKGGDGTELEFLVYGLSSEELGRYKAGNTYRIFWAETLCLMEPFDDGYQRRYVVYKIEDL